MHFSTMVLLKDLSILDQKNSPSFWKDLNKLVYKTMFHYGGSNVDHDCLKTEENLWEEDCYHCDQSLWDWYTIGGRWSGALTGYDPYSDPSNKTVCRWCNGLCYRVTSDDTIKFAPCVCTLNSSVPGIITRFDDDFNYYLGDVSTLNSWRLTPNDKKWIPYYIITDEPSYIDLEDNDPSYISDILNQITLDDRLLVVVDCHN